MSPRPRCAFAATGRRLAPSLALLALCATLLAGSALAAEEGAGTRAAGFLSAGDAPAVLGMGGATLALGRDVQGAAFNPAALGWVTAAQASLAHADFADQTSREWLAFGSRLGGGRTRIGLSALVHDEGSIDGRDEQNQPTGSLRTQDLGLTLQLARPFGEHVAIGGAAHYVGQHIGDVGGQGVAFDAGFQVRMGVIAFALAGQDFGGGMVWDHQRWNMPATLGAGVALDDPRSGLRVALDWSAPADYYRSVRAGAEWRWHDRFALRGGWRHELGAPDTDRLGGPAFGMGTGTRAYWLDYGYLLDAAGTATHRVSLSFHGRAPAPATPEAPSPR